MDATAGPALVPAIEVAKDAAQRARQLGNDMYNYFASSDWQMTLHTLADTLEARAELWTLQQSQAQADSENA